MHDDADLHSTRFCTCCMSPIRIPMHTAQGISAQGAKSNDEASLRSKSGTNAWTPTKEDGPDSHPQYLLCPSLILRHDEWSDTSSDATCADSTCTLALMVLCWGAGGGLGILGHASRLPTVHLVQVPRPALLHPPVTPLHQVLLIPAPNQWDLVYFSRRLNDYQLHFVVIAQRVTPAPNRYNLLGFSRRLNDRQLHFVVIVQR